MSRKPTLLAFSHLCSPIFITGGEKLLLFMLRELTASFSITLVVPEEGIIAQGARQSGMQVIVQPNSLISSLYQSQPSCLEEIEALKQSSLWPALINLMQQQQPDLVLTNTCVNPLPAIVAKALGIPSLWSIMETLQSNEYTHQSCTVIHQNADWIIGISHSTIRPFVEAGLQEKTSILSPSWDHEALRPHTWARERINQRLRFKIRAAQRVVGFVASAIYPNKGFEHFMQMALQVAERHPETVFLIIGNPVDLPSFEAMFEPVKARQWMARFRWIRFEQQIERIYPAMDILVVPSLADEGFGLTAMEGMIFGKAVVSYRSGGLEEIHQATGNEAWLAPKGDTAQLTQRVEALIQDEALLRQTGAANRVQVLSAFGIAAYRERLRLFLDALCLNGYIPMLLVKGTGPTVYLLEEGRLRPFDSEAALLEAGYRFEQIRTIADASIAAFPLGEAIRRKRIGAAKRLGKTRRRRRKKAAAVRLKKRKLKLKNRKGKSAKRPAARRPLRRLKTNRTASGIRAKSGRKRRTRKRRLRSA